MSWIYPEGIPCLYYVEFERGDRKGEFTVFKRQWLHTKEELEALIKKNPENAVQYRLCNEVHPWNIFTAEYGPDGSMPDEAWVRFMVDSLNAGAVLAEKEYATGAHLPEDTIHGKPITKEQAYEGLGDPSTWAEQAEKLRKEFERKPGTVD